ncbi:MAG: tRNA (adenosine(37)-N6)-threonylcarbamoyltransferase complex transferase subunit TsaD [Flavobacteriales bacterium]|nr:tRNA (adenosine(37)-N6)-threonylcarbamoyltransferase complex transferase subunit TsaD [Flavobacteriales bacterium]
MTKKSITILGIESSCDDTSAAVIKDAKILSNIVANQEVHQSYGGVVPELASRAHQQNIVPVVNQALKIANISKDQLDAIAFTRGPGLMGSLLVGTSFAKSFSLALNIPLIDVNHMQGHIMAHFIDEGQKMPEFPFLCLTVSGGHTQIVLVKGYFEMEILGETIDDAAGEAFDKSAKILGLQYPGGPLIDKYAKQGDPNAFKFTKPRVGDLEFSFSGLKSNIIQLIQRERKKDANFIEKNLIDLCASIQHTIISILLEKIDNAVKKTGITQIAIAGGVSANSGLRNALLKRESTHNWNVFIPKFEYCTDNAAMIAIVGYYKYQNQQFANSGITAKARIKI